MDKYKAIIFDLGKVVFDFSFDRVLHSWAAISGRKFFDIKSKFAFDTIFDKFEKNEIESKVFREEISKETRYKTFRPRIRRRLV